MKTKKQKDTAIEVTFDMSLREYMVCPHCKHIVTGNDELSEFFKFLRNSLTQPHKIGITIKKRGKK